MLLTLSNQYPILVG